MIVAIEALRMVSTNIDYLSLILLVHDALMSSEQGKHFLIASGENPHCA